MQHETLFAGGRHFVKVPAIKDHRRLQVFFHPREVGSFEFIPVGGDHHGIGPGQRAVHVV